MGLIFGFIQHTTHKSSLVSNSPEARKAAEQFIKDHHLPEFQNVLFDPSNGNITIRWEWNAYSDGLQSFHADLTLRPGLTPELSFDALTYGDVKFITDHLPDFKWV